MSWQIIEGDARERLRELPAVSVQTCVTSPPYFGLRDYGHEGQIGLEPTPDGYVAALVETFREVRRVLRDDGTVWLNLGDSYAANPSGGMQGSTLTKGGRQNAESRRANLRHKRGSHRFMDRPTDGDSPGEVVRHDRDVSAPRDLFAVKHKDLLGIPWMVAFALRADGWYLRSDIIWAKPNPMPESVTDRPTKAHEYLFLLSKGPRYFYDADAIREAHEGPMTERRIAKGIEQQGPKAEGRVDMGLQSRPMFGDLNPAGRNKRSVWTVATQPYPGAHFATFPPKLIEPCILAGSRPDDVVLDPFAGAGTTGMVALRRDRSFVGIELNAEYAAMARARIRDDGPLFNIESEVAA